MTGKTHAEMREEVMRKLKHWQTIQIRYGDGRTTEMIKSKVVAFYPEFVLCQGNGYKTCYRYYDLWARMQSKG